jgi:hypothetical protein
MRGTLGRHARSAALGAALLVATGCGPLTIRTWITVDEAASTGFVQLDPPNGNPFPLTRIQGGFLAKVTLDTTQILSSPMRGSIEIEEVRLAARSGAIGRICVWNNPAAPSQGTLSLDLGAGTGRADIDLDLRATTSLSANLPPAELLQPVTFELQGFTLDSLLEAATTGATDGLFATQAGFEGESEILGTPVLFSLDVAVTNGAKPPLISADQLAVLCGSRFDEQGAALFHGLNARGSYLQAKAGDEPLQPLVIALADLGAVEGDTLRIERVGTYSDATLLKDGTDKALSGVFSATPDVLDRSQRARVPGALDAGPDVSTGYLKCLFLLCRIVSTDIPQDFRIDPASGVDVVVPTGASYLIVAPLSPSYAWEDNSGFGFGVDVTVNP